MKKTTKDTRTAAQAYDENWMAIWSNLNSLRRGLDAHHAEALADPKNWGRVGDLAHVNELLAEAARFINGEEE
jgi:hypothetical protein